MSGPRVLWRVFPWDREARPGEAYDASYVPPTSGRGRFDLPVGTSRVLYCAEAPEHAVAELLQPWRGRRVGPAHLKRAGWPLALVGMELDLEEGELADLCVPETLAGHATGPDRVASRHRGVTQPIARELWAAGYRGLRWWSALWGDWHGVVVFVDRVAKRLTFREPEALTLESAPVRTAAELLGIEI